MMEDVEIVPCKVLIRNIERHVLLCGWIHSHCASHRCVRILEWLHAGCRMQVKRDLQTLVMDVSEKLLWLRKEQPVPAIAAPSQRMPTCIVTMVKPHLPISAVPVHINDQHIQRRRVLLETADQLI